MHGMRLGKLLLEAQIEHILLGNPNTEISHVRPLDAQCRKGGLSYCTNRGDVVRRVSASDAAAVFCPAGMEYPEEVSVGRTLILVANPRLAFARALRVLFPDEPKAGIHSTAVVDEAAIVSPTAYVGPYVVIGERCHVGARSAIHASSVVYPGCWIGEHVVVHAGCVIGAPGFGYERDEDGVPLSLPHVGSVRIEDGVILHPMVHIARGTLEDTVIGAETRIDTFCHIAHNVTIGANCLITAHAELSGGVQLGDGVWIAPSACVREKVRIGARAVVGMGAVVTRDVPEGLTVMGVPARPADEFRQMLRRVSGEP